MEVHAVTIPESLLAVLTKDGVVAIATLGTDARQIENDERELLGQPRGNSAAGNIRMVGVC